MLADIRKNVAHPYIKALLGLIIFVFIFFFGWSMKSGQDRTPDSHVVKVNGTPVSRAEYAETYSGLVDFYRQIMQGKLGADQMKGLDLEKRALDIVIDRTLLDQEARNRGIKVSDDELKAAIENVSMFKEGEHFSAARYHQILASQGIPAERYEEQKRREILTKKVEDALGSGAAVSDAEIEKEYREKNTKVVADYVAFDPEDYVAKVVVTDQRLKDLLAKDPDAFRMDERRSAKYVFLPVDSFTSKVTLTDEVLKAEYKARAFQFQEPETASVRHILIKAVGSGEEAMKKAEARANDVRKKITSASSFNEVAKKESDDAASKAAGGELGRIAKGTFTPEFEQIVFNLKTNETSSPIKGDSGYHIFQISDHRMARERAFEEVREELSRTLKREKARELAYQAADNLLMDLEDKKISWDKLPAGIKAQSTGYLTQKENEGTVKEPAKFVQALFSARENSLGELVDTPEGAYVLSVASKRSSSVPTLEEARATVEARFRVVESKNLAKATAELFAADAAKAGWASAVSARKLKSAVTDSVMQKGAAIPPLGSSADAKKALFEKAVVGSVTPRAYEIGGKFAIFHITSVTPPDMAALPLERDKLVSELIPAKRDKIFEEEMDKLRKSAKIEDLDPALKKDAPAPEASK